MHTQFHNREERSVLASLRSLVPDRQLSFMEALRIAEWQAIRLRELANVADDAMPEEVLTDLPRLRIVRRRLPTSGMSYWDGTAWVLAVNAHEPEARQRFTLFHEYKHILDHGQTDRLYAGSRSHSAEEQAEQAADYFAGCLLMPKRLVKRAWGNGVQTPQRLAERFEVSPRAVEVRLAQLGLTDIIQRCPLPTERRGRQRSPRYYRISKRHEVEAVA